MEADQAFEDICDILNLLEGPDSLNILATLLKAGIEGVTPIEKRIEVINDIVLFLKEPDYATQ
ncbi:hypothetical protein UFOVP266_38 [uncultured Caudovirales phage]|uniref:Uncharacterized protein n=1 Tax=uncultured Caudovirales phage TaxID=2100421 RepID=A0A6J5LMN3_9CAUD|nr:hypothetical protein UFOVP266_38 [uncultured Caudovirales phage]